MKETTAARLKQGSNSSKVQADCNRSEERHGRLQEGRLVFVSM
jgi:hypothetical protein